MCPRVQNLLACKACAYPPSEAKQGGYDARPDIEHFNPNDAPRAARRAAPEFRNIFRPLDGLRANLETFFDTTHDAATAAAFGVEAEQNLTVTFDNTPTRTRTAVWGLPTMNNE